MKKVDPEARGHKASKETRQLQLIEATIDSLAKRGYSETTTALVAVGAGLSRGIVNFHFESKDKLLVATLQYMADEYAAHRRNAYAKGAGDPARQLACMVAADFDRSVCSKRKLAAWCAFWGEAKSRPTYQALCGTRDQDYQNVLAGICEALKADGGYDLDARTTALTIDSMLWGLWLQLLIGPPNLTRETACDMALAHLATIFPKHFSRNGSDIRKSA